MLDHLIFGGALERPGSALGGRELLLARRMSGLLLAFSLAFSPLQSPAQEKAPPEWLIRNVIQWLPLVERWHPDFPGLDPALVLGVIAQESQGFPHVSAVTQSHAIGLMQIIPRSRTGTRTQLQDPGF